MNNPTDEKDDISKYFGVKAEKSPADVQKLLDAMRGATRDQESTNGKNIKNPRTGATGDFQVLPVNVPDWTWKHLRKRMSVDEFTNDRDAQIGVFNGEMGEYLRAAKAKGVDDATAIKMAAAGWYGGKGAMHRYEDDWRPAPKEPSFREYTSSVYNKSAPYLQSAQTSDVAKYFATDNQPQMSQTATPDVAKYFDVQNPQSPAPALPQTNGQNVQPDDIPAGFSITPQVDSSLIDDTPEKLQKSLQDYRRRVSDELLRAKIPARRNILQKRLAKIDADLNAATKRVAQSPATNPAPQFRGTNEVSPVSAGDLSSPGVHSEQSQVASNQSAQQSGPLFLKTEKGLNLLQSSNQQNLQPGEIRVRDTSNDKGGNYIAVKVDGGYTIRPENVQTAAGKQNLPLIQRPGQKPKSGSEPKFSVDVSAGEFVPVEDNQSPTGDGQPTPRLLRSQTTFASTSEASNIADNNLRAISGVTKNKRIYRQKPSVENVYRDAVLDAYGSNAFEAEAEYTRQTGKSLFGVKDKKWIEQDINENWNPKTGEYDNVGGEIAPGIQNLIEAYSNGGAEGMRQEIALKGKIATADFASSRERAAEERTRAEQQDEILNPSVVTSIEKVLGNVLGLNAAGNAKLIGSAFGGKDSQPIGETLAKADRDTESIRREYGSFEQYEAVKKYASEMSFVETSSRRFAGFIRGTVNTAISSNLQGIDVVDKLVEKVSEYVPLLHLVPEKYRPSLRNVENGIGYTIASLLGKGDQFKRATADSVVDERLFYNIGKNIEELMGDEPYLKNKLGYKLSEAMGSAAGFMIIGFLAPEATIGEGLKAFSVTSGVSGALGQAGSMYSDARRKGLSENKSLAAGAWGLPLGATEGFGVGAALNKALSTTEKKAFTKLLVEFFTEGAEEGGQETIQGTGQDAVFAFLQDKDPSLANKVLNVVKGLPDAAAKNITDGGAIGFLTGGVFSKGIETATHFAQKGAGIHEVEEDEFDGLGFREIPDETPVTENQPQTATPIQDKLKEIKRKSQEVEEVSITPASTVDEGKQKPGKPVVQGVQLAPRNNKNEKGEKTNELPSKESGQSGESVIAPAETDEQKVSSATDSAHDAATSPTNNLPEPTQAQIEAGNYKKGHLKINGLQISVENPAGSERKGKDPDGKEWSVKMNQHYGYFKRTVGADTENIDVFVKDGTPQDFAGNVYVVDQVTPDTGKFDEHKVMLGFDSEEEARSAYSSNYTKDWKGLKSITAMSMSDFKKWSKSEQAQPAAAENPQLSGRALKMMDNEVDRGIKRGSIEVKFALDSHLDTLRNSFKSKGYELKNEQKKDGKLYADVIPVEKPEREFSSTQVNLPKVQADKILSAGKNLIPDADLLDSDSRETEPHTTVTFGLKTNNENEVREILKNVAPFELSLGKVSMFPPSDSSGGADVVKVDVEKTPDLLAVHNLIKDSLENEQSFPDYVPHVTLAYVKQGLGKKYVGNESLKGVKIPVTSIAFSSKDRRMIEIPLGGATKTGNSAQNLPTSARNKPETQKSTQVDDSARIAVEDIHKIGGALAGGIVEGMYDNLWGAAQKGETKELGAQSAILQAAKKIRERGGLQTREEFIKYAQDFAKNVANTTGAERQSAGRDLVERWSPKTEAKPETTKTLTTLKEGDTFTVGKERMRATKVWGDGIVYANQLGGGKQSVQYDQAQLNKAGYRTELVAEEKSAPDANSFYINLKDASGKFNFKKIDGEPIEIEEFPGVDLFVHSDDNGSISISEAKSGQKIANGKDLDEAKANAIRLIGENGIEKTKSSIERAVEKSGLSPRYQAAENTESKAETKSYGADNKTFTRDAANRAREVLRQKLRNLEHRTGIDPEILMAGMQLAGFHIEAGARKFTDYAKKMTGELGDGIKPFLKSFYLSVKAYPGFDSTDMDSERDIDRQIVQSEIAEIEEARRQEDLDNFKKLHPGKENSLQSKKDESKTDSEVNENADGKQSQNSDHGSDAGESAADVRGTEKLESARQDRERSGERRDGNLPADGGRSEDRSSVVETADAGENSKSDDGEQPGERDSDRSGDGVRADDGKRDYLAPAGTLARQGSWRETAKRNLDIIELVKKLEAENRLATPEEQELLIKFTGWGASEIANSLFPGYSHYKEIKPDWAKDGWKDLATRAKELFTPEELATAARSTRNAHYTSEKIVRGIWNAFQQFGFKDGKVLEPGMGVGLFWAAAPESVAKNSRYTGIERDSMTARIAKQVSQKQAILEADFTKQNLPDNFFDIAIGNPPFADTRILNDPRYKKQRFMLHDYFFAKSIDKVRPGGLLVFVTSKGTMDKGDTTMREYIADRADLLGAIRLPQTAFKDNAGTEVVTDVLFFRKRADGEMPGGENWINRSEIEAKNKDDENVKDLVNEYFVNHPEMVLGSHSFKGSMYKKNEYTVLPLEGDIEEHFQKAIEKLPTAVYADMAKTEGLVQKTAERDFDPKATKEGSLYIHDDGRLMRREYGSGTQLSQTENLSKNEEKWLRSYVAVRNALKQAQTDQLKDGDWKTSLAELNRVYDEFVAKHGRISEFTTYERTTVEEDGKEVVTTYRRYKNNKVLGFDVESPLVESLERVNENGEIEKAAPLLSRTINKPQAVEIKDLSDALAVSLDTIGSLNLAHVTELMQDARPNITRDEVVSELGDAIYLTPSGEWQLADEYLSGFVIDKLEEAEAAAASDRKFQRNVEALLRSQPKPVESVDINAGLGSSWIGADVVSDFASEVMNIGRNAVTFQPLTNTWVVSGASGQGSKNNRTASSDWGTAARSSQELLEAALNNRTVKVSYKDDKGKTIVETEATTLANERVKKIREAFRRWVWADAKRAGELSAKYNRQYNNIAPRSFDGSHLSTPGLSSHYKLHPHQKRAVWRVLQTGNTYLAHAVGAGKTLEMIVSAMEQKRLGLIRKPMFVVPGHMLKQFAAEFMEAYPMANILVADENNFAKEKRKRFVAQAALNDLDAVVITHTSFGLIRTAPETADVVIREMVEQMRRAMLELDETDTAQKRTIKDLEGRIEKIEQKFGSLADASNKDDVINFEELGVDFVYVDEAHEFRKLDFVTNRTNVKGIDSKGSQRSLDLLIKLRWLESQRPGRSAVLASGTPITNTLAEMYSIMRYLDPAELENADIAHFDAWSNQFGEVVADYEMNAAGNYEIVERFSKFINIPELMKRARKFMDVLTLKQLGGLINLPTVQGGTPGVVVVPATEAQKTYLKEHLAERIETSRKWKPSRDEPNNPDPLIAIIGDGRLAAIDMRFVDPTAPSDPNSKLNVMLDNIAADYETYKDVQYFDKKTGQPDAVKGATQIVFSAVGFGSAVAKNRGFDVKGWMLKRLTESGIPASEIAFMSDYDTAQKKENLFKEMRQGTKKILFGSPKNMGTGVNVQKRLMVEHYLSPPWYPADVEQPDGRIIRQGNQNEEIIIRRYATKGTYDSTAWAMIARKSRAIEQAMSGDDSQRSLEDISESSQYEMASAVSAGDDRAIKLAGLRRDIEKLERLRGAHSQEQRQLVTDRKTAERNIGHYEREIEKLDGATKELGTTYVSSDAFKVQVAGTIFEKNKDIGDQLKSMWQAAIKDNRKKAISSNQDINVEIGKILGKFPVSVSVYATPSGVESRIGYKIGEISRDLTNTNWGGISAGQITDVDSVGLSTRMLNSINQLAKDSLQRTKDVETETRKIKQIKSKIGQPFAEEQELYEKIAEYAQLQAEMAGESTGDKALSFEELLAEAIRQNQEQTAAKAFKRNLKNFLDGNPYLNEPDTQKQILNSTEGKKTLAEMKALQYQTFDELLPNAAVEIFGDRVQANAESHEIYRRSFEEARVRSGQTKIGSQDTEDLFGGIFLKPETVKQTVEILREKAQEAKSLGYSAEETGVLTSHADALEKAAKSGKGTAIIYVFDDALPEEIFHQSDYVGAADKSILKRHSEEFARKLDAHEVTGILWRKIYSRQNEYKRLSGPVLKAVIRAEIAPMLAKTPTEELAKLGISEEMRDDYLLTWFEGYVEANGIDSLDNFEKEELNVQRFIEKLKTVYAEQIRADGRENEERASAEGKQAGETRAGPRDSQRESGNGETRKAGNEQGVIETPETGNDKSELETETSELDNLSPDTKDFFELEKGQKLASLPATMRAAGIDAADVAYEVFGDAAARESALKMLEENGIDGAIRILDSVQSPDADHAVLSFMLQRVLFDNAAQVEATNPELAANYREKALEIGRDHALKAVRAGRFTRAASVVQNSVQGVIYTAQGIVKERFGQSKSLSAAELARIEAVARESEEAVARAIQLTKEKKALERKIKRLEDEKEGKKRSSKRSGNSLAMRKKVVDLVKKKHSANLDEIRARLLEQFSPATVKSIIGEFAELTDEQTENLKSAYTLEKQKSSAEEIYAATGWERGTDGKWRFDLGEDVTLDNRAMRDLLLNNGTAKLSEVLNAPKLFEAYPEVGSVKVVFEKMARNQSAYFDQSANTIALSGDLKWARALGLTFNRGGGLTQTLLHETQHAIQKIEGFSFGTNSKVSGKLGYFNSPGEVEARNVERRSEMSEESRRSMPISQTEDVSRQTQLAQLLVQSEPATMKRILDDGSFDEDTLNDFATVGAMILTEGLASENEFLPEDFKAQMIGQFGDVIESNFQEIYYRAYKMRNEWLSDIRAEQTKQKIREQYDEDISDEEIEEILGERKERAAHRRAINTLHRVSANKAQASSGEESLGKRIGDIAPNQEIAVAARILSRGGNRQDVAKAFENLSKDESYKLYLDAAEILSFARKMKEDTDEIFDPIQQRIEDLRQEIKNSKKPGMAETRETIRKIRQLNDLLARLDSPQMSARDKHIEKIIVEKAKDDPDNKVSLAAALLARKKSEQDIYNLLGLSEEGGISGYFKNLKGRAAQRELLRQAHALFEEAKTEYQKRQTAILDEISKAKTDLRNVSDAQWQARQNVRDSGNAIKDELRRIKTGGWAYRASQVQDVLNVSRTLMASLDLSGSLRQGGFLAIAKPEAQKQAFANMFTSFTQKSFGRAIQDIEAHPNFVLAQRSGITFAEAGGADTGATGEELYRGKHTLEKIPALGWLAEKLVTGWSERTYTSFLDTQRMAMFDIYAKALMSKKLTFENNRNEFEKIAEFINVATGRGAVPQHKMAELLMSMPFFAPRYTLSRLRLLNMTLNPVAYYNMPPEARKTIAKSAARFYSTTAAFLLPFALLGLVSFDPDDDNFLKIKIGSTRYDIFAGELQPAKMLIKLVQAAWNTKLGQDERIAGEFWYDTMDLDHGAIPRFVRGKLSPVASLIWDASKGTDFVGNEFSWGKAIVSRIAPLLVMDLITAIQSDGAMGVVKYTPAIFGIGASTYPDREGKPETAAEKLAAKAAAMSFKSRPQTQEEKDRQRLISELTVKMRNGNDVAAEATKLVHDGKLEKSDVKTILENGQSQLLEAKAEKLKLDDFEAVFRVASDEERLRLMPMLGKKMKNAEKNGELDTAQRLRLESLGGKVTGYVEMPEKVKEVFDKFEINTPDVGDSLTLKKGEKQSLSYEQYDKYRREALTSIYDRVQKMMDSDAYKDAETDDKREELIRKAIRKGRTAEQKDMKRELKNEQ